jgi:PKD domain
LLASGCSGDGDSNPPPPPPAPTPSNAAPTVRPGGNQNVVAGATVQLDGTASTDPDGNPLTYRWTLLAKPAGSSAALTATNAARPSFVADLIGTYTAALVVNDGALDSTTGLVTVTAGLGNVAPVARFGVDQTTIPGATVHVDGSASSDANGDALTYRWAFVTRPAGSTAALAEPTADSTRFVPDLVGTYTLSLTVSDGQLTSVASPLTVTVVNANVPPVADAGPAQRVATGAAVLLDGSRSRDPNGDALSYVWSLVSRPAGSTASLGALTGLNTGFSADVAGTYVVGLVVNDGNSDSAAVTVVITAFALSPLPTGAGTWAQANTASGSLAFSSLEDIAGTATASPAACARFAAADARPDGTLLAVSSTGTTVMLVDARSGVCRPAFSVAEPMVALAVAADGVVHVLSAAATGGARQLYRHAADGSLLGRVAVSGSTTGATLQQPEAMDFAPDGTLLVLQAGSAWQLNTATGVGSFRAAGLGCTPNSGDIDIDAAGQLRCIDGGRLQVVDTGTWATVRSVALQPNTFGPSALVRR